MENRLRNLLAVWLLTSAVSVHAAFYVTSLDPTGSNYSFAYGASDTHQVGFAGIGPNQTESAVIWTGSSVSAMSIHPDGFATSSAWAIDGSRVVGSGNTSALNSRALLWDISSGAVVNLHPASFVRSQANGVSGSIQVGTGSTGGGDSRTHALAWSGSAATMIDLHQAGWRDTWAYGVDGTRVVGVGRTDQPAPSEALLWNIDTLQVVVLTPQGWDASGAVAISGLTQVGSARQTQIFHGPSTPLHAALWYGSAASFVDLHPAGFYSSSARAVNGGFQAGTATLTQEGGNRAMLWRGSASSAVNLHSYLSPGFTDSWAFGVTSNGSVVGGARANGRDYAIMWNPVPEPTGAMVFGLGLLVARLRRCRTAHS